MNLDTNSTFASSSSSSSAAAAAAASTDNEPVQSTRVGQCWRLFFMRAVAVPPARFRPPSKMGDTSCEHPQVGAYKA